MEGGPALRRRRKRPKRGSGRDSIRAAALSCFARFGVDGSTTRDIALEAGLTEGALYRHFASKDEIVQTVFAECARRLVERLQGALAARESFPERVLALVQAFFDFSREEEAAFRLLGHEHFTRMSLLPRGTRLPKDVVVELCAAAPARLAPGDPVLAAACLIGIVVRSIQFRIAGLISMEPERFLKELGRASLRVLGVKP